MIIHPLEKKINGEYVYLSAKIEFEKVGDAYPENRWYAEWNIPDTLWFRLPKKYEHSISTHSNSFLVAILGVAMHLKENIHVKGTISTQLLYNLAEYQRIAHFWCPDFFFPVLITADVVEPSKVRIPDMSNMCSISGGFDSLYTIWSHLPRNMRHRKFCLSHTLYIEGFDVPLNEHHTHEVKKQRFKELVEAEGLEFVSVATNIYLFLRYKKNHNQESLLENAPLWATVLLFEGMISRFYFSSEDTFKTNVILNAPYLLMPLISTEGMQTTVYGEVVSKHEKIETLMQWPQARALVVCCHTRPNGLENCGACEKCLRIIVLLAIEGRLQDYKKFPDEINIKKMLTMRYSMVDKFSFLAIKSLLERAYQKKKWVIYFILLWVILTSNVRNSLIFIINYFYLFLKTLNSTFNPIFVCLKISEKLKRVSPTYNKIIYRYKNRSI